MTDAECECASAEAKEAGLAQQVLAGLSERTHMAHAHAARLMADLHGQQQQQLQLLSMVPQPLPQPLFTSADLGGAVSTTLNRCIFVCVDGCYGEKSDGMDELVEAAVPLLMILIGQSVALHSRHSSQLQKCTVEM